MRRIVVEEKHCVRRLYGWKEWGTVSFFISSVLVVKDIRFCYLEITATINSPISEFDHTTLLLFVFTQCVVNFVSFLDCSKNKRTCMKQSYDKILLL